jgi:7,8-dihydropterin-6-yl-methyl-4-(beta-D-ribofuranosyl)aminobenzene 5'-phosphate synthase
MHLLNADENRLSKTVAALRELDLQHIGLAHCTGLAASARLYNEFPNRCSHCVAGTRINLPASG